MFKNMILIPAVLIFTILLSSSLFASSPRELIILNWGDYLDPELIEKFEKEHNSKITEVFYSSDETRTELLLETDGKGYDLILTSGVDLAKYVARGWLAPLDGSRIPNLKYLDQRWRTSFPDAEKYAVPYFWGTLGIAYRSDLVKTPITTWEQLFVPDGELKGRIGLIDDNREIVAMALKSLGHSMNTEDRGALAKVKERIKAQKPYVKSYTYISLDENSSLVKGDIVATMAYNGDALMVAEHNENIVYVLPEEGGNIWVDYFAVAAKAKAPDQAYEFLEFINNPENAAQQANFVYCATPNTAAEKLLDQEFLEDPAIYPSESALKNSEFYKVLSPRGQRLWNMMSTDLLR